MKFWNRVENLLKVKNFLVVPIFVALLGAVTTLSSLRDQTHEIERVGTAWVKDGAILYAQAWSHHTPQTLFVGSLYSAVTSSTFVKILIEIAFVSIVSVLVWANLRLTMPGELVKQRALLMLASCSLLIPGSWQLGVTPAKMALLFINLMIFGYFSWKNSSHSEWLGVKSSKNPRYLMLTGLAMSLTIYTSWFYAVFVIPILVDLVSYLKRKPADLARWLSLLIVPIIIETWLLISVLAPRELLGTAIKNSLLDLRMFGGDLGLFRNSWALLLSTVILVTFSIIGVRAANLRKNPAVWVLSLIIILTTLFFPAGILQSTVILISFAGLLYTKEATMVIRPGLIAVCALFLVIVSLPLRTALQSQLAVDKADALVASSYVEQRLIDSRSVYYYGSSAGFYELTDFVNPTRFYDSKVFVYDNPNLDLISKFRGDIEAERPLFVVYATGARTKVKKVDRLEEYFAKHYELVAETPGYKILKRSNNL